jgi:hypothetical protein
MGKLARALRSADEIINHYPFRQGDEECLRLTSRFSLCRAKRTVHSNRVLSARVRFKLPANVYEQDHAESIHLYCVIRLHIQI